MLRYIVLACAMGLGLWSCKPKTERKTPAIQEPAVTPPTEAPNNQVNPGVNSADQQEIGSLPRFFVTCDVQNNQYQYCYEWENVPEPAFGTVKETCDSLKGTLKTKQNCSRTQNVGGCTQGGQSNDASTMDLTIFYYGPSYTAQKVKQGCEAQKEIYIQP